MGQERGKAMLVAIEQQNQLNLGLQQQLQLADSLSQVLGQGLTRSFDLLIDGAQNWGMALRDIAATVLRDIARQLIQIYVIDVRLGRKSSAIPTIQRTNVESRCIKYRQRIHFPIPCASG